MPCFGNLGVQAVTDNRTWIDNTINGIGNWIGSGATELNNTFQLICQHPPGWPATIIGSFLLATLIVLIVTVIFMIRRILAQRIRRKEMQFESTMVVADGKNEREIRFNSDTADELQTAVGSRFFLRVERDNHHFSRSKIVSFNQKRKTTPNFGDGKIEISKSLLSKLGVEEFEGPYKILLRPISQANLANIGQNIVGSVIIMTVINVIAGALVGVIVSQHYYEMGLKDQQAIVQHKIP